MLVVVRVRSNHERRRPRRAKIVPDAVVRIVVRIVVLIVVLSVVLSVVPIVVRGL